MHFKKYRKRNTKPLISGTAEMTVPQCLGDNEITRSVYLRSKNVMLLELRVRGIV